MSITNNGATEARDEEPNEEGPQVQGVRAQGRPTRAGVLAPMTWLVIIFVVSAIITAFNIGRVVEQMNRDGEWPR